MNFSDENLPHSIRVQSRSSSSSSSTTASKPSSRVPSTRVIVTSPVEEKDDQFEQLLSLIATDRSPSREDQEGKGLESVGGGSRGGVVVSSPLGGGKRANGRFMEGLGVGRSSEPASLLSPNHRPSISKPSRLSSYSSVPTPPSTTLRPPGSSPPPPRPHSVASGERPTPTESIFSTSSPPLFSPLPPRPSTIHELPSKGTAAPPPPPSQVSALRPQTQTPATHSRNPSASSSNSATSVSYRVVGPPVVMKADLTLEEDPFGARSSPVKEEAFVGAGGEDDEDSFSSDEDSSGSDAAEHVERLIPPPSSTSNPNPFTQSQQQHNPTPPHSIGSPTQVYHHPAQQQHHPQPQPSLPPTYPQQHQHHQLTHLPPRHPQNIFQPPHLPPSAATDFNSFVPPGGNPPAYPHPNATRTTSLTMQIAQSEGWAIENENGESEELGEEGVSASSEGGGGEGRFDDQREFLTRPLGLLALSQALSAANDEVDALRSVVRDATSLVHAQAQDAFVQAQIYQQQQQRRKQGGGEVDEAGVGGGGGGLTDREIDELSGSEAREMLKSLATPPPSQITSSLALIKHLHQLASLSASPSINGKREGSEVDADAEEREIYSDSNLMRLAEVVEGWKGGRS